MCSLVMVVVLGPPANGGSSAGKNESASKIRHGGPCYVLAVLGRTCRCDDAAWRCSLIPLSPQICPENVSFKEWHTLFYDLNNFYPGSWLKDRKKAYIFWRNPLQKNMMCMEGRQCSYFHSVPCTGVSWDGTLKPANCSFSLMDYPTEIQSIWQTGQRTTIFEHITVHSEKSGVQTAIFQSTVIRLHLLMAPGPSTTLNIKHFFSPELSSEFNITDHTPLHFLLLALITIHVSRFFLFIGCILVLFVGCCQCLFLNFFFLYYIYLLKRKSMTVFACIVHYGNH